MADGRNNYRVGILAVDQGGDTMNVAPRSPHAPHRIRGAQVGGVQVEILAETFC